MKLGMGLYRDLLTPEHLRFAKQAGCTHIIAHLPGQFTRGDKIITSDDADAGFGLSVADDEMWSEKGLRGIKALINREGLELEALENFAPRPLARCAARWTQARVTDGAHQGDRAPHGPCRHSDNGLLFFAGRCLRPSRRPLFTRRSTFGRL